MVSIHRRILIIALTAAAVLTLIVWKIDTGQAQGDKGKKAVKHDPDALDRETFRVLNQLHKNKKYPINNFDELAKAMGGKDATVTISELKLKVGELQKHIPASIFPIASEEDLNTKISQLRGKVVHGKHQAASIKAPAGEKPPTTKDPAPPKKLHVQGVKKNN